MHSNCYVVYSNEHQQCVIIDPAARQCENIMPFLIEKHLIPSYIIATHEHVDHTWGCNYLRDTFQAKLVCSSDCFRYMNVNSRSYFQLYYDDCEYDYQIEAPDFYTDDLKEGLCINDIQLRFHTTPGHSIGSICIEIVDNNVIISGDTLMQTKPYIAKPTGNKHQFAASISFIKQTFRPNTIVYPGHGDSFELHQVNDIL